MTEAAADFVTRSPRVMIVEDERVVATHVERSLRDAGYTVTGIAASAAEAAHLVDSAPPDVALVDIRLRGSIEGFAIAEHLHNDADVPVVYMTAHTDDDTLQRAARTGAYGYVVKPFTIGEVKSALQVALYKHRLDQQLAERERWFSATLRAIADGVVACDAEQRVTFLNAAAERMLGLQETAAQGSSLGQLLHGAARGELAEVALAMRERRAVRLEPETLRVRSRSHVQLEGTVAPILRPERVLGAVLVLHDVTEQRRRDAQLALTDRLSSLGTLVASVAHEINNPLAYTIGNVSLALAELEALRHHPNPVDWREQLDLAMRSLRDAAEGANRVANTVKELRAFGRMEEQTLRPVDPRACVDWAIRLTSNQLLHQARLLTSLRSVPKVNGNELKLSQVVVNLLSNAVQALTGERHENEVHVSTWTADDGSAVIEVEDNGRGMTPEVRASVFEPFFTTKDATLGTGLGLSICRTIVTGFGGEIGVDSEPGRGTRFRVRLPACAPEPSEPAPHQASTPAPPPTMRSTSAGRQPKLLLVDDEPMIRSLVAKLLLGRYHVIAVDSVRAALPVLSLDQSFDLLLCDLMMPGDSGIDFYGVVRQLYPSLLPRLAFITGGAVTTDATKFLDDVARPVLAKPFAFDSLLAFVDGLMASRADATREPCPP